MSIVELMEKAKKSASKRSKEDREKLLIEAKILDLDGNYDINYFSKETVNKNKLIAINVY
jgi:hypothetical protein